MERGARGGETEGHLVGVEAEFPRHRRPARLHPESADHQTRLSDAERQFRRRHQTSRPHHRRRIRISDPVARLDRAGLRRSPTTATAHAPSTPRRRSRTTQPKASPSCSICRPTRCGRSGCSAPAPMAATTRATPPPTPPCCQNISAGRCACSTCATRASPGIRRARRRSTAAKLASTRPARSSPMRTSARHSRART